MIARTNSVHRRGDARTSFWLHVAIFNAMVQHWDNYGRLPTLREIGVVMDRNWKTIHAVLDTMIAKGYIERAPNTGRTNQYLPIRHPAFYEPFSMMPRMAAPHGHKAIVVECNRHLTSHAQLTFCEVCIVMAYGALVQHLFKPEYFEVLYFNEHPEIRALHDGVDWSWAEVRCLTITAGESDSTKPLAVCLMENKARWIDEAIQRGTAI